MCNALFSFFSTRISWNSNYPPTIIIILLQILPFNFFSLYFSTLSFFRSHHKEFVFLSSSSNPNQLLFSSSFFQHISFYHVYFAYTTSMLSCGLYLQLKQEQRKYHILIFAKCFSFPLGYCVLLYEPLQGKVQLRELPVISSS